MPNSFSIDYLKEHLMKSFSALSTKFIMDLSSLKRDIYNDIRLNNAKDSILITSSGSITIMKKALEEQSLSYFKNISSFRGFIKYLFQFISDLKKVDYSKNNGKYFFDLEKVLFQFEKVTSKYNGLHRKYDELFGIISSYEKLKSEYAFFDPYDMDYFILTHLNRNLKHTLLKRTKKILLLSFNSSAGLDLELIDTLSKNGIEIILSFFFDPDRPEQFFNGRIIKENLDQLGFKDDNYSIPEKDKDYFIFNELLSNLFVDKDITLSNPPSIGLIKGDNVYDEVLRVAKRIKLLLYNDPSLKVDDIAIIVRNPAKYEYYINDIFNQFNLPYYGLFNRDLLSERLIIIIFNIMELKIKNFPNDLLISFIKSNYVYLNVDLVSLKGINTNTVIKYIDKYYNRINSDVSILRYLTSVKESLDKGSEEIDMCIAYVEKVIDLINEFPYPHKELCIHDIYDVLKRMITNNFSILYNTYKYSDMDTAKRDSIILSKFFELLDEFIYFQSHIIKDGRITLYSFYNILKDIIYTSYYNPVPNRGYGINILTEQEVYGITYSFTIVFILGLVENGFPKKAGVNILIREYEKVLINDPEVILATMDMQARHEELLLLMAIGCLGHSGRELYLSYPKVDEDNRDSLPSFFLDDVISVLNRSIEELGVPVDDNLYSKEELYNYLGYSFSHEDAEISFPLNRLIQMVDIDHNLLNLIRDKCIIEGKRSSLRFSSYEGFLTEDRDLLAKKLKDKVNIVTSSHLEVYGECPYRFFLYYVLGLKKRKPKRDMWESHEKGSIVHRVLFELYQSRISDPSRFDVENHLWMDNHIRGIVNKVISEYNINDLYLVGELDRLIKDISIFINKDLLENIGFRPFALEIGLAKEEGIPLKILTEEDNHFILLEGIIDRIDISYDGDKFNIIDYKTGKPLSKDKLIELITAGQRFQPLIYSIIAEHIYGSFEDYSYYFVLDKESKKLKKTTITLKENIPNSTSITLRDISSYYVELYLNWIYSGRFHLSPKECANYCEFINICRVDKVLSELKQKDNPFWKEVNVIIHELEQKAANFNIDE